MTPELGETPVQAVLLDIEGTTTPIDFVFRTLFPYARARVEQFLAQHAEEPGVREDIDALRAQHAADRNAHLNPPAWLSASPEKEVASAVGYARWLMDRDSKCSALKSLQGKIWQQGYQSGELCGEVYPDVPPALDRWSRQGKAICIFSSGSVLAQKLLFGSTAAVDLTRFLRAYFDTTAGPKNEPGSYGRIAAQIGSAPQSVLFVSDVARELDAARDAGMQTALCVRTQPSAPISSAHRTIHSFDELFLMEPR